MPCSLGPLERAMNRALAGDLNRVRADLLAQVALKTDQALEAVDQPRLTFNAVHTVFRMHLAVPHLNHEGRQLPAFPLCIDLKCHGCAGAERDRQIVVQARSATQSTEGKRFVREQMVRTHSNNLLETALFRGADPYVLRRRNVGRLNWPTKVTTALSFQVHNVPGNPCRRSTVPLGLGLCTTSLRNVMSELRSMYPISIFGACAGSLLLHPQVSDEPRVRTENASSDLSNI